MIGTKFIISIWMKIPKNLWLLILIISCNFCNAQNWNLINATERFHYGINNSAFINATLKVDSLAVNNSDSTFYLNRVIIPCDTCVNIETEASYNCSDCLYEKYASQFAGKLLTKLANAEWLMTDDNATYLIKPHALMGDVWMANESVEANVANMWEDLVLGETDSLKSIVLENNINLIISKHHGIIQFNAAVVYNLIGIGGRDLGALVPNFESVFNYSVGDVLQYNTTSHSSGTFNYTTDNSTTKLTIASVTATDLAVNIAFDFVRQLIHWTPGGGYVYQSYTGFGNKSFVKSNVLPEELYNHQYYERATTNGSVNDAYMAVVDSFMNEVSVRYGMQTAVGLPNIGGLNIITDNNFNACFLSPDLLPQNIALGFETAPDLNQYNSNCLVEGLFKNGACYARNLGIVHDWWASSWYSNDGSSQETSGSSHRDSLLVGYVHNGIQYGTITSDSMLLAVNNARATLDTKLTLYPNPAEDLISINYNFNVPPSRLLIFDSSGRIVLEEKVFYPNQTWNLSWLSDGVYVMSVELKSGQVISERIVKR